MAACIFHQMRQRGLTIFPMTRDMASGLDFFPVYVEISQMPTMKQRYICDAIGELAFASKKMAFLSGPRQCGKTTLAKMLGSSRDSLSYHNWDDIEFRRLWTKSPKAVVPPKPKDALVILDEIHKDKRWKRTLKGVYDTLAKPCDIIVTGSARLNVFQKGSDSLLGRYFHFRLSPFSLREMQRPGLLGPDEALESLFSRATRRSKARSENLSSLLEFGPFPDPLFRQDKRHARLWRQTRHTLIIREDLRDLSNLPDLGRLEMLAALLPGKVGAPFSLNAMREDIEVAHGTLSRWIDWLKELYFLFEIKPYSHRITRSLKKEGKIYMWDYAEVQDPAARFENLVAHHLLKACHYWTDTGEGDFQLCYLRDKERHEIDFLILRDGKPWLPVEAKLSDTKPSPNWRRFLPMLGCDRGLQIVQTSAWKTYCEGDKEVLVAGADEALFYFA